MATQIKLRRDTAANWSVENPILAEGEPGLDTTNNILKIGNGTDTWTALPSIYDPSTNIIPSADNTYDLGSPAKQWRHVYMSGGSLYLDNIKLTNNAGKLEITKVINPGEENEEPDPEDSNAGDSVTSKLTKGEHTFELMDDGSLELDGDPFTGGGGGGNSWSISRSGTTLEVDGSGNVVVTNTSSNLPVIKSANGQPIDIKSSEYAELWYDRIWSPPDLGEGDPGFNIPAANQATDTYVWTAQEGASINVSRNTNGLDGDDFDRTWSFDTKGAINLPDPGTIRNTSGAANLVATDYAQLQWTTQTGAGEADPNGTQEPKNWVYVEAAGVYIETNINSQSGQSHGWSFGNDGNLQLPQGGDILDSNGNSVLGGGGGSPTVWVDQLYYDTTVNAAWSALTPMAVVSTEYDSFGNIIALVANYDNAGPAFTTVMKINSQGVILAQTEFADSVEIDGWGLAVDSGDSVYLCGQIDNGTDQDMFVSKLNSNLQEVWSKKLDGTNNEYGYVIDCGGDDHPVVVGTSSLDSNAIYTVKLNKDTGNILWQRYLNNSESSTNESAWGMAVGTAGEVVAVGAGGGNFRQLVVKYDAGGTLQWQKEIILDDGLNCYAGDAEIDFDGNIYVLGAYEWGGGNQGISLTKLNGSGVAQWTRKVQGPCAAAAASIVMGDDGFLYISSSMGEAVNDGFMGIKLNQVLAKYNADTGTVVWQRYFKHASEWMLGANFFNQYGAGSNLAVKNGRFALGTTRLLAYFAGNQSDNKAILFQGATDGSEQTFGGFSFIASSLPGTLGSPFAVNNTNYSDNEGELGVSNWETGTEPGNISATLFGSGSATNELVNGQYSITLNSDGRLSLPNLDNTGWNYNYNLNGPTLKLGDSQNQVIITGPTPTNGNPNAQRIVIQGQRGYGEWDPVQPVAGEGGDVYIWGGVGGEGSNNGSYYGGSGGDIKVRGGQGQNNDGGYVKIEGGQAADFNGGSHTGGYVEIRGGDAVEGGNGNGGDVRIFGGKKQNTGNNGEVHVSTGANEEFEWRFDNGGALNLATNNNISNITSAGSVILNADTKSWSFDTTGRLTLPEGGDITDSNGSSVLGVGTVSELVGDGHQSGTGLRTVVYANWQGYQGGESNGELFNSVDVVGFNVGDHITFRNGEQRVITSFDTSYAPQVYVQWDASVDGAWNNPRYPAVFTTDGYLTETKKTARIKPDLDTEGSGQYMEVYVGGNMVVDNKHVHMTGHHVDTELFLGSDNNFVSAKDAGNSPARVNLQSENDITVSETNLRMARGSNWANIHGDGVNRNFYGNTADLSWTAVESDEQGNFYVGGESHTGPNSATIAKYGPDGDLIWRKMIDNDAMAGWRIDGIAYNPVDKEVAFAVATDWDWDYDYTKIGVFDSETGELKTTTDLWDEDGHIRVTAMTWHPVLGYSVTGQNQGEVQSTSAIRTTYESVVNLTTAPGDPPQDELWVNDIGTVPSVGDYFEYQTGTWTVVGVNTYSGYYGLVTNTNTNFGVPAQGGASVVLHHNSKSGVGYITIPSANAKIGGFWPVAWNNWFVSGTGINGNQLIQSGLGLFRDVPVTTVTGSGVGMTYGPRVVYYGGYYENYSQGTAGTGYNYGDQVKILGSALGGVDGGIVYDATQTTFNTNVMYFDQATYPTLDVDVTAGVRVRFNNLGDATVTSVTDAGGGSWAVNITMNSGTQSNGIVTFYHGNDLTAMVVGNSDLTNFAGVPALTNIRIDMGYDMGYGSTDFTGGTFTLSKTLDNRAFVWNTTWAKFVTSSQATYSTSIAVDRYDGGLIVGGTQDSTGRAYIWKMAQDGTTNWIKGVDIETGYHSPYGITVSAINGAIYYSDSVNSITKLGSNGSIIKRVQSNGAWGQYNPIIKLVQDLDGEEYLYVGSGGSAEWMNYNGFILNKLTANLQLVWSRDIWNNNSNFNQHYGYFVNNFALGKDNAVLAGYGEAMSENYTNAILVSISTGDEFTNHLKNNWHLETSGAVAYQDHTEDVESFDFLTSGSVMTVQSSSVSDEADVQQQTWTKWGWKSVVVNLNATDNGIVGVESIKFANGGTLDHNPSDIPPAVTDFNNTSWNYTLQLSDRGKFIINQPVPNSGYAQHIYITVPSNLNVDFPVGSVITLINTNDANNNGYKIYVQPENYGGNDAPRIWAVDLGNQNPSTWSFQGMQIGRLMKIGSNEWLLDAKNIINED